MQIRNISNVYIRNLQNNSKYNISRNNRQKMVSFGRRIEDEISVNLQGKTISLNYFIPKTKKDIIQAVLLQCKISSFITKTFPEGINNADPEKIFNAFGIETQKDENGLLTIHHYSQPNEDFTWNDIGVDENRLLNSVNRIFGYADFNESNISSLGNIEYIGGDTNLSGLELEDIGKLKHIDGNANFMSSKIKSLNNLKSIKYSASFNYAEIEDFGDLTSIGENATFFKASIKSLGNLASIKGDAQFDYSTISSLGKLKFIGGDATFINTQIKSLDNLETVGGSIIFIDSEVENLGNLKSVGENYKDDYYSDIDIADFRSTQITDLGNLQFPRENCHVIADKNTPKSLIKQLKQQKCEVEFI